MVRRTTDATLQALDDGDLQKSQRSLEVKNDKLCATATIFGQKRNDGDVHGGRRSTEI